ncbi:hypothetical protein CSB20_05990, partial [bacterium DOLZORAL124_64_63]
GDVVTLDREESHHMGTVLRGGRWPQVVLTDGRGHRFAARVTDRSRREVRLEILTRERGDEEFRNPRLVLGLALIKPRRFEWALEKAVELGAHRIVPLISEHTDRTASRGKDRRWRTIMVAAIKQCGRCLLPELDEPMPVRDFLARRPAGVTVFGAIPEEITTGPRPVSLLELPALLPADPVPENLTALIGPQGGWSAAEVGAFLDAGLQPISLGPHILRTETAAAAVLGGLQLVRGRCLGL